jgi:tripartite-type tricarboxylate transporter receptor subunit TctC
LTIVPWAALFGPAKMPSELSRRLSREVETVLQRRDVHEQLDHHAFEPASSTPDELARFFRDQFEIWRKTVRETGIKLE